MIYVKCHKIPHVNYWCLQFHFLHILKSPLTCAYFIFTHSETHSLFLSSHKHTQIHTLGVVLHIFMKLRKSNKHKPNYKSTTSFYPIKQIQRSHLHRYITNSNTHTHIQRRDHRWKVASNGFQQQRERQQ